MHLGLSAGEINFPNVNAPHVVMIYGELLGNRRLESDRNSSLPGTEVPQIPPSLFSKNITLRTQTPVTNSGMPHQRWM